MSEDSTKQPKGTTRSGLVTAVAILLGLVMLVALNMR
jgi:hypothetical protein